ncbi:ATP-binding mismatch repair protein [Malassezia sp. CBS 17886]|nr:ATP-binding mismatch repair protein [Malassezia sp. CBS 17886]
MSDEGRRIAPLARPDIHRITSAQVVPDMRAVVKELVENALDAGATSIEVRFREWGADGIEVIDNGSGVSRENYEFLALKHHTSKLSAYEDLGSVATFGFRGEALASLCSVASVSVLTATERDVPMGTVLQLDHHGHLVSSDKRVARQRGTTVTVTDIMSNFPVRRRELEKNIKREYAKAHAALQAYALISQGVRWASSVTQAGTKKGTQLVVRSASGPQYMRTNAAALFGARAASQLQKIELDLVVDDHDADGTELRLRLRGLISHPSPGCGRSAGDRQYFYMNGRPWDSTKLASMFNQVYRTYNASQYPCVIVDLEVAKDAYDVNVSPDKRTIFLHYEARILSRFHDAVEEHFAPARGLLAVNGPHLDRPVTVPRASPTGGSPGVSLLPTTPRKRTREDSAAGDDDEGVVPTAEDGGAAATWLATPRRDGVDLNPHRVLVA